MKLSIVVPCFNEEKSLPLFYAELKRYLPELKMDYELILVDDGSRDLTFKEIEAIKKIDRNTIGLRFSRNFGKEAAILAGLKESHGDMVVLMDADLQDPPYLLPQMLSALQNDGYDSVATYRVDRAGEPPIRSFFARRFYKLINKISDVEIVDGARDYRMMTRSMVNSILELTEVHRFSKGIFTWVGYHTKYLAFENVERVAGETKWNFWKLFKYAIEGIVAFTTAPLRISMVMGFLVSFVTLLYMVWVIVKALLFGDPVAGYPSMMAIILFLGGIQLLGIGVLGEYLSKTYMEVKKRPHFIIKDRL